MAVEAGERVVANGRAPRARRALDYTGSPAAQWRLVAALTLLAMLSSVDRQALALLVEPIKADLHLSDGQIGLLMGAAMAVTGLIAGPPAGFLADRICRRCMVGVSAIVWSVLTGFSGLSATFGQMLGARLGIGVFEGVAAPVTASMLRDALSPERRGRGFAVFAMASLVGTGLAMLAGGGIVAAVAASGLRGLPLLGALHPWQMVFVLFGLAGLPGAALMLFVAEPERQEHEAAAAEAGLSDALAHFAAHWRVYVPLMAFAALHAMLGLSFAAWAPALLGRTWGLDPARIGLTFGVMLLVLAPMGLTLDGAAIDRAARGRRRDPTGVGIIATLVIWLAATVMPISPTPLMFWSWLGVLLFASGTATPVASTIMAAVTPSRAMGKLVALQGLFIGVLSATIAPSLPPLLAETLFAGRARPLGDALSFVVAIYGFLALVSILVVRRTIRTAPAA